MRKPGLTSIAVAAAAAALAMAGTAQAAAPCTPVATSYDSGGAPSLSSPNDPLLSKQWGLQQIKAPGAWAHGAYGAGATIAVVDTGVDLNHPDLKPQLVDGVDLVSGETCTPGAQDLNGHGTHVAGIAAAATNNGIGVAGTAPLAKVMPVRVLDSGGAGSTDDISNGIRWAADHGAQVINLSIGEGIDIVGITSISVPVELGNLSAAVDYAFSKGAVVVAAAGNETMPFCDYPSASAHAICVGATDSTGFPSSYSNFPARLDGGVAVRAPGGDGSGDCIGDIWSTYWPGARGADAEHCPPQGYEAIAGTSMATPFVSGVAAILRGAGLTNTQVMDCIKRTSSNAGSYDPVNGYGIVSAEAAVAVCTQLPLGSGQFPGATGQSGTQPAPAPGQQPSGQGGVQGQRAHGDSTPPVIHLSIPKKTAAHVARAGYVTVRVRLSEPAKIVMQVLSGRETAAAGRNAIVLAKKGVISLKGGRSYDVRLRLTRAGRRALRMRRAMTVTLIALARDAANNNGTAITEGRIRR